MQALTMNWPWIWLLLPLPLLINRWCQRADFEPAPDSDALMIPPVLASALDHERQHREQRGRSNHVLLWLAWLVLIAALSQPYLVYGSHSVPASGRALVLAIDLSGSMDKRDFILNGQSSNRLEAVKTVASDFVAARRGDRVGLVLFGDQAFVASPLTFDTHALAQVIDEAGVGMAGRTTAIGDALGLSIVKLRLDPAPGKAIILLSDGTNNAGSSEPEDAASLAAGLGIRVHTIALSGQSTDNGRQLDPAADLDIKTLRAIAQTAKGQFFRATSTEQLQQVYAAIGELETADQETPPLAHRQDLRNLFLVVLLALLTLDFLATRVQGRSGTVTPR